MFYNKPLVTKKINMELSRPFAGVINILYLPERDLFCDDE